MDKHLALNAARSGLWLDVVFSLDARDAPPVFSLSEARGVLRLDGTAYKRTGKQRHGSVAFFL